MGLFYAFENLFLTTKSTHINISLHTNLQKRVKIIELQQQIRKQRNKIIVHV
jgi:hypothetical protein